MRAMVLLLAAVAMSIAGCGSKGGAESQLNNRSAPYPDVEGQSSIPLNAGMNLAFLMQRFPEKVMSPVPWIGYWWPYQSNGISVAAAKYETASSSGGAVSWERGNHGQGLPGVADWWGHCNGWAAAAVLTPEPRESREVGGVAFGVSDRKALLSETFMEVRGDFLGNRVDSAADRGSEAFNDVWPAQFFVALKTVMGANRRPLIMDRFTGHEVWNHPIAAYRTEAIRPEDYLGPDPEVPQIHRVNVTTTVFWVQDNVEPDALTPEFDAANPGNAFGSRTLRYELWLDAAPRFDASGNLVSSGDIILTTSGGVTAGGRWKNSSLPAVNSHPDYLWIPTAVAPSTGFKNPRIDDAWVLENMR